MSASLDPAVAKGKLTTMEECIRLGCTRAFEGVRADHLAVEPAGVTSLTLGKGNENLLLFAARGVIALRGGPAAPADPLARALRAHGDVVLCPSEAFLLSAFHGELVLQRSPSSELYILSFLQPPPRAARSRVGGSSGDAWSHRLEIPDHVTVLRPARLTHLLRRLMDETRRPSPSRAILHHLVALALCELAHSSRASERTENREAALESIASRVDAYIAAHYHEPIGTPDIAAELRYNPDYLERAYHLERRISIREAVHDRRIKEVRAQLLLQRGKGVAEVAALCGYADPAYFRRVFKRATNMTPCGYRRVHADSLAGSAVGAAAR
ncbi:MAG TPA: AraC family transcriptional regulator [Spirochaetia bacterium]|nr:AraC family transcriptional regulator [Spirochaetia bacterium]